MRANCLPLLIAVACSGPAKGTATSGSAAAVIDQDTVEEAPGSGSIEGTVTDPATGRPISLASVRAIADGVAAEKSTQVFTDGAGRYALRNLAPGSYTIAISHGELQAEAIGVVVLADRNTTLNQALSSHRRADARDLSSSRDIESKRGSISGVILDGVRGKPIGGVVIEVFGDKLTNSVLTIANESGRFEVPSLEPGTYAVSAYYTLIDKGNVEVRRSGIAVTSGVASEVVLELDTEARR